jgi:chorismate dehydratase
VASCLIVSQVPLAELDGRPVALGSTSRTSVRLAELLLSDLVGVRPSYFHSPPSLDVMLGQAAAAVLIGDPALRALSDAPRLGLHVADLGQMWRDWTGLPFVFVLIAARREFADRHPGTVHRVHAAYLTARDLFLRDMDVVSELAADRSGVLDAAALTRYYTTALDFTLGERHLAGVTEFARRLNGRIPLVPPTPRLYLLPTRS